MTPERAPAAGEEAVALWRFGVFELDERAGELRRRGTRLPLRGIPLRVLVCLLRRAGEVVTRGELRRAIWGDGVHLDFDNSLNSAVTRLRASLDDEAANPRFVETLPRYGYRFVAPVRRVEAAQLGGRGAASLRRPGGWRASPRVLLLALAGTLLAAGLAATLGLMLRGSAPQAAAPTFPPATPPSATAARSAPPVGRASPAGNTALDAYVRGRRQWNRRTAEALWDSVREMERAVAAAPSNARAHAGLAHAHLVLMSWQLVPVGEAAPRVEAAARRALALDPGLAEAHVALASLALERDWDWATAQRGFRLALELDPDLALGHQFYAEYLAVLGSLDEARRQAEQAVILDPLSSMAGATAGFVAYMARDYELAEADLRRTLELDADFAPALFFLSWVQREQGRLAAARASLDRALELVGDGPLQVAESGYLHAVSGEAEAARRALEKLRRAGASANQLAVVHLGLGDLDATCRALRTGMARRERTGLFLRRDPRLDAFRRHPCYAALERTLDAALGGGETAVGEGLELAGEAPHQQQGAVVGEGDAADEVGDVGADGPGQLAQG